MVTFTLFICLLQIQNTEICNVYCKSAKKYRDIQFLLIFPSPTLKKRAFGNIFCPMYPLVAPEKPKASFFSLTEFMPFKLEYN